MTLHVFEAMDGKNLNIVTKSEKSIFDWLLNIHRNIKEGEEESL